MIGRQTVLITIRPHEGGQSCSSVEGVIITIGTLVHEGRFMLVSGLSFINFLVQRTK